MFVPSRKKGWWVSGETQGGKMSYGRPGERPMFATFITKRPCAPSAVKCQINFSLPLPHSLRPRLKESTRKQKCENSRPGSERERGSERDGSPATLTSSVNTPPAAPAWPGSRCLCAAPLEFAPRPLGVPAASAGRFHNNTA